jgi:hypothetical protein
MYSERATNHFTIQRHIASSTDNWAAYWTQTEKILYAGYINSCVYLQKNMIDSIGQVVFCTVNFLLVNMIEH